MDPHSPNLHTVRFPSSSSTTYPTTYQQFFQAGIKVAAAAPRLLLQRPHAPGTLRVEKAQSLHPTVLGGRAVSAWLFSPATVTRG